MTIEERLTALESDRAILNRIASEQMLRLRDIEHNETLLLGMVQSQGQDIRQVKADVNDMKERLAGIESRLERMETHFDERLDALMAMVNRMQSSAGR
jgi:hypothetical protein